MSKLDAGDVVVDREDVAEADDETADVEHSKMLIRNVTGVTAMDRRIGGMDATVADLNENYDPLCNVVEVVYFANLDKFFGREWRTWLVDDADRRPIWTILQDHADEWGIPVPSTYDFPADRLKRVDLDALAEYEADQDPGAEA